MNVELEITQIETLIEKYEDSNNPEDRMDFKQTALNKISTLQKALPNAGLDEEDFESVVELLNDFQEVLSY